MNTRPLVVITTRLPPQVCGIGTYSWLLHQHWPGDVSSAQFLVVAGAVESASALQISNVSEFNGRAAKLVRSLDRIGPADLFLHYAGRAYHRYGCPIWLPSVLAKGKTKFRSGRLLVCFHDIAGNFPLLPGAIGSTCAIVGSFVNFPKLLTRSSRTRVSMPENSSRFPGGLTFIGCRFPQTFWPLQSRRGRASAPSL